MIVEDTIFIGATPAAVWEITVDIEAWPTWTPTVARVTRLEEGELRLGSQARIAQPGQLDAVWTITELVPPARFTWVSQRPGMRMIATHELTEADGGTVNCLRVEATGIVASVLSPLLRLAVRRALRRENRGLKERCERCS